ncbi:hypothetical protein GCM10015535_61190 [Streptomyces gelaticus]|uniref:Aminoglycoside phosphotransferase n=1 Tax=Streptomyces gelaticus TaxID=285446 RepID=A0ABQ2W931_9ACTN|nr:hypothetical protein GCM10015535_61190 [Streptomyces gelaticus]
MPTATPDGRAGINAALVKRLIAAQFPQWSRLPVIPVPVDDWDNRTYRLGDDMTVRLPTAAGYAPAVDKECNWLPRLRRLSRAVVLRHPRAVRAEHAPNPLPDVPGQP